MQYNVQASGEIKSMKDLQFGEVAVIIDANVSTELVMKVEGSISGDIFFTVIGSPDPGDGYPYYSDIQVQVLKATDTIEIIGE